ncbi:MAG: hypothetical protein IT393_10675 [Nitrospirae bacterium]|nr:hypothetical protein [Nitrospirota bacterium]
MKKLYTNEFFYDGIKLLKDRRYIDALDSIKTAIKTSGYEDADKIPATYLSYLGLATALAEKKYRAGALICENAIKKEFYNPLFYLNLGKVYAAGGYKLKAIEAFNKGLQIDGSYDEIINELKKMGIRRRPIVPFLTRTHALNKHLGLLLYKNL